MAGRRKRKQWTPAEWIAFGNRVKALRKEIHSMAMDVQPMCLKSEVASLLKCSYQLDKWKSSMENVAAKDVPASIVTRIFYGDPLPEDAADVDLDRNRT